MKRLLHFPALIILLSFQSFAQYIPNLIVLQQHKLTGNNFLSQDYLKHALRSGIPGNTIPGKCNCSSFFNVSKIPLQDSTINKKKFGPAARLLMLGELAPFTFDRYVTNKDYARISFQTVGHNLNPGSWTWDNDGFETNQIGHPFHGSIFFNSFRSNGYSFWQSAPAAFAGSYIWETFSENQEPAPNDFINTGFGGIILGEVTHRLSNKIINNRSHGFGRQASEVLAFIINPMNGFNRIINGKWGKVSGNSAERDSTRLSAEFDMGLRKFNVNTKNPFKEGNFGLYGLMKLSYGTPAENLKNPFSNFYIITEFGQDDSSKVNMVSVYGSLTGWKIPSEKFQYLVIISANYDYINNEAFFYSGQSVKMNLFSEFVITDKIKINTSLGGGVVVLAAVPDGYQFNNRNYDYGPGVSFNGGGRLNIADKFFYSLNYRGGWMKTVNGNQSDYFVHVITNNISLRIKHGFSINAESGYFNLHGNYKHFADVNKTYPYLRLSVRYTTGL